MAKSKRVSAYSARLLQIANGCSKTIRIPVPQLKDAQALRFELYGLRRAILHEGADALYPDFCRAKIVIDENPETHAVELLVGPPEDFDTLLARIDLPPLPDFEHPPLPTLSLPTLEPFTNSADTLTDAQTLETHIAIDPALEESAQPKFDPYAAFAPKEKK